ncbi:seipin-like [Physella acuta]|uniref:seipin-like n=1 Tax=Physella acuta TaxID=109671 RepID=UPI0027DC269A|nr:seipin-like [Physella acuta]
MLTVLFSYFIELDNTTTVILLCLVVNTRNVCPTGTGICSFPSGNVSFWNEQGTIQETLSAGQAYTVVLELEMPDSPANRELGMFMLSLKMIDREGQVSLTSERSAVLKYRSLVSRLFDLFVWSPFYFFGYSEEKQTLTVNMFTHYVDDYYHPSVGANIEVHSYKIEIYSATLNFFANFTGLKYFLYFWPITSAFLAFSFNLFILSLGMAMAAFQRSETLNNLAQLTSGENQNAITHQAKITVSKSTMTEDLDQPEQDDDKNDLPLIQEPADFHLEPGDDGMDFVNELRQRRIN